MRSIHYFKQTISPGKSDDNVAPLSIDPFKTKVLTILGTRRNLENTSDRSFIYYANCPGQQYKCL